MGKAAYKRTGNLFLSSGILFAVCTVLCLVLGPVSGQSFLGCVVILVMISAMAFGLNPLLTHLMPMMYLNLNRVALAAGLLDAMVYVGSAFSGSFAGYLSDSFGWDGVFLSWAVVSLIGTLLLAIARRMAKRGTENT